jgi:uncharacterized membrane protein YcaP (DUF421 family)
MLLSIDLLGLDQKDLLWYQMMIRAILVFIIALVYIRIAGMRTFGTKSSFDVVLSITMGAVLSRAISGHYPFFACLAAAITLAIFHRLVAYLSSRSPSLNKLVSGKSIQVFAEGALLDDRLKKFHITNDDVIKTLHEQNLDDFEKVKSIWIETDGKLSVVKK